MKKPEESPSVPMDRKTARKTVLALVAHREAHRTDISGFSQREEEEFLLAFGPRKVRKAIKERRKAREHAKKQSK